jgi:hypothetical protein
MWDRKQDGKKDSLYDGTAGIRYFLQKMKK